MNQVSLNQALESKGWTRIGKRLYPPNKMGPSIEGSEYVPIFMIEKMYKEDKKILEMELQRENLYPDKKQFRNWIEDINSLVDTLEELLEEDKQPSITP